MFFKVATFMAMTIFMVQPNEVMLQYSPIPVVNDAIKNFVATANTTLQNAINQTNIVTAQFNAQIDQFEAGVSNNVTALLANLDSRIAAEVARTGGAPEKIYNCTKLEKPKIDAFANNTFYSLTGCATEKITQGINAINEIYKSVSNLYKTVTNATTRINAKCPAPAAGANIIDQLGHLGCVTTVIAQITVEMTGYTLTLTTNVAIVSYLIADIPNFPAQFATCLTTRSSTAALNLLPIIGEIALCTIFG